MKNFGIFIDLENQEQVEWWSKYAKKKVNVIQYEPIIETATGKIIGVLMVIGGIFAKKIFKENDKFFKGRKLVTLTNEELNKYRRKA